jgi:beta-lactamase regulating signal transducer with metallopeptidase domain
MASRAGGPVGAGGGIALGGLWLLRNRSPLDRASWLKLALALLLALPLRPLLPRVEVTLPRAVTAWMAPPVTHQAAPMPMAADASAPIAPKPHHAPPLPAMIYGLGVAGLIAHLVLGIALLNRWSARGRPLHGGRWTSALAGSGTPKPTRLLVSEHVRAPLSWGLRRPVILIDPASAARDHDAPAILAHEAAHIARGDWLTLMAARLALAVFWFNPLVWVMLRALVQQCEEAADARALAHCEPTSYAETLMTCLAGRGKAHRIPPMAWPPDMG